MVATGEASQEDSATFWQLPVQRWALVNIWRFPYLAAKYGGGIFLLVYILLTVSFGYVLIMSETSIGRMTKKSPVGAFSFFGKTASI